MKLLTMDFLHGFQAKCAKRVHVMNELLAGFKGLKLVAKTILLALVISALPSLGSAIRELPSDNQGALPLLFHELSNEGHLKSGDKVLVITRDNDGKIYDPQTFGNKNEIAFVANTDIQRQSLLSNEHFDFVFTHDLSNDRVLIDRTLKVGGIVTYEYTGKFQLRQIDTPPNYEVVYFRRHDDTSTVTLHKKKNGDTYVNVKSTPTKRRLLGVTTTNGKKQVLEKLEDVLLEPPRASRSRKYLKRTRYLPNLLGDSLESYPRRVFIDVGPEKTASGQELGWFAKHYPMKNKDFEMYKIDTVAAETGDDVAVHVGMSDWLRRNVREEEYVVMKAEAEVVEEMVKNRALALVDELFLECKYQGVKGDNKRSRRAYWECLALYGRLRDEGVAVHQWWG